MNWAVISKYYDNGKIEAEIFSLHGELEKMNDFKNKVSDVYCDTYIDKFESCEEAEEFKKDCLNA